MQVSVVLELQCPAEEPQQQRNMFTSPQRRREPTRRQRAPVRVVLVLDVSHSMSEPYGHVDSVDHTEHSQVTAVA